MFLLFHRHVRSICKSFTTNKNKGCASSMRSLAAHSNGVFDYGSNICFPSKTNQKYSHDHPSGDNLVLCTSMKRKCHPK